MLSITLPMGWDTFTIKHIGNSPSWYKSMLLREASIAGPFRSPLPRFTPSTNRPSPLIREMPSTPASSRNSEPHGSTLRVSFGLGPDFPPFFLTTAVQNPWFQKFSSLAGALGEREVCSSRIIFILSFTGPEGAFRFSRPARPQGCGKNRR